MSQAAVRTMLIGAGEAGVELLHDLLLHPENSAQIVCIIDDAPEKWNTMILGCPVVGGRDEILRCAVEYGVENIILAIPSAAPDDKKSILEICRQAPCALKTLPSLSQFADPYANIRLVREVSLDDLLGREPSNIDLAGVSCLTEGKTVLVTGGGGSIGAEVCRQIAALPVRRLIIFDIYENTVYDIQQELLSAKPDMPLQALIGSIRDNARLESIFAEYRPEIIFHAAAHKHVPLMEDSPHEAVKNNVLGTWRLASLADKYHAENFLFISTDKAVNPTNIMGATKRIGEMIIQADSRKSATKFAAVRFGNVLGSNGSVIPLFQKQIAQGGPVTVTHPEVTRFFMTIPEAVSLVLAAAASAKGGEIFVLDMGEPIRVLDMARNLIRLSGLHPERDIKIVYTGLRPGEKLYEEILMNEEGLRKTDNRKIYVAAPLNIDTAAFMTQLKVLDAMAGDEKSDIRTAIRRLVPEYKPAAAGKLPG